MADTRHTPSVDELATMPEYLREFHLRYMDDAPSQADLDAAIARAIRDEFASIGTKIGKRVCYFIQAGPGGLIKIGWTADLKRRLARLQTANGAQLEVLAVIAGGPEREAAYHTRFEQHRARGEWFAPHPDILGEIATLTER